MMRSFRLRLGARKVTVTVQVVTTTTTTSSSSSSSSRSSMVTGNGSLSRAMMSTAIRAVSGAGTPNSSHTPLLSTHL